MRRPWSSKTSSSSRWLSNASAYWKPFPYSDGATGPGFKIRPGLGSKTYPPYLQSDKFKLRGLAVLDVIGKGAAGSWQMENRGPTMLEGRFDFGFAVDWMRKDLGICLEEAERNGAALPVTALVDQFYKDVQRMGGGRGDTSSLIRRLA